MGWKRKMALAAAVALCFGMFAGCGQEPEIQTTPEPLISMKNDGGEATIRIGELKRSDSRTRVLEETAEKYRADFPNTTVEIRSFSAFEELRDALRAGEIDIAEVPGEEQLSCVEEGLLIDLYPYLKAWDESATLTAAAQQAVASLGQERAYLIPSDFTQDLLYYRADWFDQYNEGLEKDLARLRIWDEIAGGPVAGEMLIGASEKLGEQGGLALAGKEKLVDYFDAMVWSSIGLGRVADNSAAYFSAEEEGKSIFTLEKTKEGVDQFLRVMENSVLPDALNWTEEQALEAFLTGEAGMLLADRSAMEEIRLALPEGSWGVEAFPRGREGVAVAADEFVGWGIAASSEETEIAAHFLTFLSNADNNTYYAKVCGVPPIHLEAADMESSLTEGDLAVEMEMIRRSDWYQYASEPVMYRAYQGYREQADEKLRQLVAGELSRDELLAFLDEYWNNAYQTEGKLWS